MEQLNVSVVGKSPAIYSTNLLDEKYENIRTEAIHAGILLRETDEKVEEMINDGRTIQSHAQNVQSNALRFYRSLIRSEKLIRYCQFIFLITIITVIVFLIGKAVFRRSHR